MKNTSEILEYLETARICDLGMMDVCMLIRDLATALRKVERKLDTLEVFYQDLATEMLNEIDFKLMKDV